MFEQLIFTIAIIARLSNVPLDEALAQADDHYIVPTVQPAQTPVQNQSPFHWRIAKEVRTNAEPPIALDHDQGPQLAVKGALVMDADTEHVLWQYHPDDQLSIASITKLMTALVWFDHQPANGLEEVYTLTAADNAPEGKELNLPFGEKLTTFNLLRTSIVGSDNDTALALAHSTGLTDEAFVAAMNQKAKSLSMKNSVFVEPTGLKAGNTSSVFDLAVLAREAFSKIDIQQPAQMTMHEQRTVDTEIFTRVRTTNKLLFDPSVEIIAGKTGHIRESGYCVVVQAREPKSQRDIIVVVMGATSDDGRFAEAKKLINWTFAHYTWTGK